MKEWIKNNPKDLRAFIIHRKEIIETEENEKGIFFKDEFSNEVNQLDRYTF